MDRSGGPPPTHRFGGPFNNRATGCSAGLCHSAAADLDGALQNAWQSLSSGGVLLISVPGITRSDPDYVTTDCWRFTPAGLDTLLARNCLGGRLEVAGHGNLTSAVAFLLGLAAEELEES